jgi:hypothetical protein
MKRVFLILALTIPLVAARRPGAPLKPGWNIFTKQQDIQMGLEASKEIKEKQQVVQNAFLQSYISKVGQRIAGGREAVASGFPFTFTLVSDASINAFALPGGPMFIHSGLLVAVDNEAQLAGVMGHELAHVILRHGTNQASKANLLQLPALLASSAAGNGSLMGQLAQLGIGFGAKSILLSYSRDAESEADALGSHLMAEAGYDPKEMARFFAKLNTDGGSQGPQFLSDHPNPGNRETAINDEVRTLPARTYGYETRDFARAKAEVAKLPKPAPASTAEKAGAPDTSISASTKTLRGQTLTLQYPDNWQASGENTETVTLAPRGGFTQQGIGLGAFVSLYVPQGNGSVDLARDTQALIDQLRSRDNKLTVTGRSQRIRVDNRDATQTVLASDSPLGGAEQDTLIAIPTAKGLVYVIFVAPQAQAATMQSAFGGMLRSIRLTQ